MSCVFFTDAVLCDLRRYGREELKPTNEKFTMHTLELDHIPVISNPEGGIRVFSIIVEMS